MILILNMFQGELLDKIHKLKFIRSFSFVFILQRYQKKIETSVNRFVVWGNLIPREDIFLMTVHDEFTGLSSTYR